ncbi:MAG: molybdopterin-dependent oxidoreductase, partial [Desulfobacterales bacterium]
MDPIRTVCARDCYDSCGLILPKSKGGVMAPLSGDPTHPITRGFTCPRGRKDHKRLLNNRIPQPHLRRAGILEAGDWATTLEALSGQLQKVLDTVGPESVLFLNYAGNLGLLAGCWSERLWNAIGACRTDGSVCSRSGHQALALHYGRSYGLAPDQLLESDLIVFWGFNAVVSSPHIWNLASAVRSAHGIPIVAVDPRRSETASRADLWISPRPGSDVALAYGMVRHLMTHGGADSSFLSRYCTGVDRLESTAAEWPLNRVAEVTGAGASQIEQLAGYYQSSKHSATMIGIGLQKQDHGADAVRAVSFVPAVTGCHRGFFYGNGSGYTVDRNLIAGRTHTGDAPVTSQVGLAERVARGDFQFIFVSCHNPALTLPGAHFIQEGFQRDDVFVAVHDTHWTQTAKLADAVLPAPSHFEKEDVVIPWGHPFVQLMPTVVPPSVDCRSEVELVVDLGKRLGLDLDWLYEDPWQVMESAMAGAFQDGDFKDLMAGRRLRLKSRPKDSYDTPSGKIEFIPSRLPEGVTPLPIQAALTESSGIFQLISSALPHFTHTQFQEVYGAIPSRVLMHPEDADRQAVMDGEWVTISNALGESTVQVTVSDSVPKGVLWSPRQSQDP